MTRAATIHVAVVLAWCLTGVPSPVSAQDPHAGHQQQQQPAAPAKPTTPVPPFIPPLSDEDRKAAFPDVEGHAVHDNALNYLVLFDQLEWQTGGGANGLNLDTRGWVGGDRDRLWYRAEGDTDDGRVGEAQAHVLYGRRVSRWWDVVAGIRQDVRPGSPQTWAAIGVQGLAPYWFDVEATAYVGAAGMHARFEVEYELLFTNRLILQPLLEMEVFAQADHERGIGAGLSTTDVGFRMRYEFTREFAPYVGVVWNNKWGRTGDFAEAAGEDRGGARFVTGLRLWF